MNLYFFVDEEMVHSDYQSTAVPSVGDSVSLITGNKIGWFTVERVWWVYSEIVGDSSASLKAQHVEIHLIPKANE